jgi:hypothetical protein
MVLNEKDTNRIPSSQSMSTNFIEQKPKLFQDQSLGNQNFVGRRRHSPAPSIYGANDKTPLKLLHYHKKKTSMMNPHPAKPIVAWSLNKYSKMTTQEKEDLLLSSAESEDFAQEFNYLDYDFNTFKQPELRYEPQSDKHVENHGFRGLQYDQRRNSDRFYADLKHLRHSPLGYARETGKNDIKFDYGKPRFKLLDNQITNYSTVDYK